MVVNSLTRKSTFLFFSNLSDTFLKLIAAILITPLITASLGEDLYGIWTMITQILSYLALATLNSTTTLKIRLATLQNDPNIEPKQLLLGAAVKLFKYSLVIIVLSCFFIVLISQHLFPNNINNILAIKAAIIIGTAGIVVEQIGSFGGNAMRGNNMDYKGIGIRSLAIIVSNFLIAVFLYFDSGLIGLSISTFIGTLLMSILWLKIAKKELIWFSAKKVTSDYFIYYLKQSFFTLTNSIGYILLVNSDAILIGFILGSKYAGIYFISITLFRTGINPIITSIASSIGASIASIISTNNFERLNKIIIELIMVISILFAATGTLYIVFNESIISYWVGDNFYSKDHIEFFFLMVAVIQFSFWLFQYIVDGLQLFAEKSNASLISGVIFILLAIPLLKHYDIKGILFSAILSRIIGCLILFYYIKVKYKIRIRIDIVIYQWIGLGVFLGLVTLLIQPKIPVLSIVELIFWTFLTSFILFLIGFFLLPNSFKSRLVTNFLSKF